MKRTGWGIVLAVGLCFGLAACQGGGASAEATESASAESTVAESSASDNISDSTEAEEPAGMTEEEAYEAYYDPILDISTAEGDYALADCLVLGEYKDLGLTRTMAEITDEEVDAQIRSLMDAEPVEDPEATVQIGDTVDVDYAGETDGEYFDGGTGNNPELVIGSHSFIDGFEDGLIGMKVGESADLDIAFPETYWNEELAGKPVIFHVTVNAISRAPEPTNAWVTEQTDGQYTTLEDYRAYTRDSMLESEQDLLDDQLLTDIWQKINDNTEFLQLPQSLIDEETEYMQSYYEESAEMYGMTLEEYVEAAGSSMAELKIQQELYARSAAEGSILLAAIAEAEGMSEDSQEYKDALEELLGYYDHSFEEMAEEYGERKVKEYAMAQAVDERLLSYCE